MRARSFLLVMLGLAACTMDNPAFGGGSETGTDTNTTVDTNTTNTTNTTAPDTGDPICLLEGGDPLEIDLGPGFCGDPPELYDRLHVVAEVSGGDLSMYTCPEGAQECSGCFVDMGDVVIPMHFNPLVLDDALLPGECVRVVGRRSNPTNPDGCKFQTVLIEGAGGNVRLPRLIGRNTPDIMIEAPDATSGLAGFNPMMEMFELCPCGEYPGACCDTVAPTTYVYNIGQPEPVKLGAHQTIEVSSGKYEFWALDGFQSGVCGEELRSSWALVYDLP